jgi:hypothetical protein
LPGTATDIEHLIGGRDRRGVQEAAVIAGDGLVETLGMGCPVLTFVAVLGVRLLEVGWIDPHG